MFTLQRKITNLAAWLVSSGVVLLGLVFIITAPLVSNPILSEILKNIGGTVFGVGVLAFLWEVFTKRGFRQETLSLVNVAASLDKAGVEAIELNYLEAQWKELFSTAERLDIFYAYGSTWRNTHLIALKDLVARSKMTVRVLFPDPENAPCVAELARRFHGYTLDKLTGLIRDGIRAFEELQTACGKNSKVEIRVTSTSPVYALYLFGVKAVFTMYRHRPGKGQVPTYIVRRQGTMYTFLEEEFKHLWENARALECQVVERPTEAAR